MHIARIAMLLLATPVFAQHAGLIGRIDLNGDSIKDEIRSGPSSLFGNAGGPLVVRLSASDNSPEVAYLIEGNGRFAIESFGDNAPVRLWTYWHVSSIEGVLTSYRFRKSGVETSHITINPGDGGTETGRAIFNAVFRKDNVFILDHISPYEPPAHPMSKTRGE